ncbi:E3 ubiquitin-protein ligase At4g11680-like [Apium graveolens]|uniref:E3 ubiquitin-protein ligase At4g11680-like n=1 Tax=Apium graveolens TaxID=4045 RepID=UPI003D7B847B
MMPPATSTEAPLLSNAISAHRFTRRAPSLNTAARFLRRASSRRLMREPSMRVRESATEQIEERQNDWAYSKPVVILDLIWNLAFVAVSTCVMIMSWNEAPEVPLRLWIVGYAVQCVIHMVCVCLEYKRRCDHVRVFEGESLNSEAVESGGGVWSGRNSNSSSESDGDYVSQSNHFDDDTSVAKHLESANTMFSFIWWIVGFYWISIGGQNLTHDSPQLYWLCITFLAFDVFFVVICVAVACLVGLAVCCCLPCIIAILYAVADQEGASKDDIERLPTYKFQRIGDFEKQNGEVQEAFSGTMTECNTDMPTERVLSVEDAECSICLCAYEDGTELRELPCRHHFHSACIDKWLYINATCPLCKFNIVKNGNHSGSDEV